MCSWERWSVVSSVPCARRWRGRCGCAGASHRLYCGQQRAARRRLPQQQQPSGIPARGISNGDCGFQKRREEGSVGVLVWMLRQRNSGKGMGCWMRAYLRRVVGARTALMLMGIRHRGAAGRHAAEAGATPAAQAPARTRSCSRDARGQCERQAAAGGEVRVKERRSGRCERGGVGRSGVRAW